MKMALFDIDIITTSQKYDLDTYIADTDKCYILLVAGIQILVIHLLPHTVNYKKFFYTLGF